MIRPRLPTPQHTTGPFFPAEFLEFWESDLTAGPGGCGGGSDSDAGRAPRGELMVLAGRVVDGVGEPAVNLILELWQADSSGIFNHPGDPRYQERDPRFRGWGRAATESQGRYRFVTVKPGPAPSGVDPGWVRPPHLAVMLLGSGLMRPLITQLFFPGEPLNVTDRQLQEIVRPERRARLVLRRAGTDAQTGAQIYEMDFVLQGKAETPFLAG